MDLKIMIDGNEISIEDARRLYNQLKQVFEPACQGVVTIPQYGAYKDWTLVPGIDIGGQPYVNATPCTVA